MAIAKTNGKGKRILHFLHLWIGLITGIIVFIISITGSIYVFRDEIFDWAHKDVLYNNVTEKKPTLPLSVLWNAAQKSVGDSVKIGGAISYSEPNRNWEFSADKYNEDAFTHFGITEYHYAIYVNPYTAEVVAIENHKYEFFHIIFAIHWSLLINDKYGQPIVGVSILLFVVSLITGFILWFPKKLKLLKERLTVKWKARWRRVNYDLHRSLGFYVFPFALIIAITGLVWSFEFVKIIVYVLASQSITPPNHPEPKSTYPINLSHNYQDTVRDNIQNNVVKNYAYAHSFGIFLPEKEDTLGTILAYIRPNNMVYHNSIRQKYDQYSGKLLYTQTPKDLNNGEKLIYMNYDIHVGQILGFGGKILAFIASLICASLPITGILLWYGRKYKET